MVPLSVSSERSSMFPAVIITLTREQASITYLPVLAWREAAQLIVCIWWCFALDYQDPRLEMVLNRLQSPR